MLRKTGTNFNLYGQNLCLFDENVPCKYAEPFAQIGYQPIFVSDLIPGSPDTEVLALASAHGALLVTLDKSHFGQLVFRDGLALPSGIIILRDPMEVDDVSKLDAKQLPGWFSSFSTDHFRQRQMPGVHYVVETEERVDRSSRAKTKIVGQVGVTFGSDTATTS